MKSPLIHSVELNIGLNIGQTKQTIGASTALQAVFDVFTPEQIITRTAIATSGEQTLVLSMRTYIKPTSQTIGRVCAMLHQDCIAGKLNGAGFLIGPNTKPYGDRFNYEYWIEPYRMVEIQPEGYQE